MFVNVKYFAVLRELTGLSEERFSLADGVTVSVLLEAILEKHPALSGRLEQVSVAVNHQYASKETTLSEGAEVALLPPVAGGHDGSQATHDTWTSEDGRLALTHKVVVPADVVALVEGAFAGAVVTFTGIVRRKSQGREVVRLEYEAYPEMVLKELARIVEEMDEMWPQAKVSIHHRIGHLSIGEVAVVIAVCTPHRKEAFAACSHAIEVLKERVPIWKKEIFTDGTTWVGWGP
tara:strand:+ start:6979 stop:7680 length:702 start_codon:yes stop_codon:yes gene_type:complete